ncbi:MAG: protealysin inhibitor emfourin [Planctomycetota bacterium]
MTLVRVERIGGVVGFGLAVGHLRSFGTIDTATLTPSEQKILDLLFSHRAQGKAAAHPGPACDAFCYLLSRGSGAATETIEAAEAALPAAVVQCVRDEIV